MQTKASFTLGALLIFLAAIMVSGCATMGRLGDGTPGVLESGVQIIDQPIALENPNGKFVFVRIGDATGSGLNDVSMKLSQQLTSMGYVIVRSPQEADYVITGQVTNFVKGPANDPAVAAFIGGYAGAVTGTSLAVAGVRGSLAALGGVLADLFFTGLALAITPDMYVAEMVITLKERTPLLSGKKGKEEAGFLNSQCSYRGCVKAPAGTNPQEAVSQLSQALANSVASLF